MKYIIYIIIFYTSSSYAFSFYGTVKSKESNEIIPYVTIALTGERIGTIADRNGSFSLNIPDTVVSGNLTFSIIGYEQTTIHLSDVRKMLPDSAIILLSRIETVLQDAVVKPKKLRRRILGNVATNRKFALGGLCQKGIELGVFIHIKKSPTYIEGIKINLAHAKTDSVFFRVNIYEYDGTSFKNIVREPIYIIMPSSDALKEISLDISNEHIVVHNNFIVALEMLEELNGKDIDFCATFTGAPSMYRNVTDLKWHKKRVAPGFLAVVSY